MDERVVSPADHGAVDDTHNDDDMHLSTIHQFTRLNDRSTEETESNVGHIDSPRSSEIANANRREVTAEGNITPLSTVNDEAISRSYSHFSSEKSSLKITQVISQHASVTQVSNTEAPPTTDQKYLSTVPTDQVTSVETTTVITEPQSSSEPLSTAQSTQQYTSELTTETSTRVVTTSAPVDTSTRASEAWSSEAAALSSTSDYDVTIVEKTTSRPVVMTTQRSSWSFSNSTSQSSRRNEQNMTSSEIGVSSGFNSSAASTTSQATTVNKYVIFGAAGLAVLFIVLMCVAIACICRKRKRKNSGIDEFDYSFDLKARQRRLATGPSRVSYSFTHNSFSDIPGALSGLGSSSAAVAPSNMMKSQSNSDNLLTRYNLEPNMYMSDETEEPDDDCKTPPIVQNDRRHTISDTRIHRDDSVKYSTFKRPCKGVELAEGFQGDILV